MTPETAISPTPTLVSADSALVGTAQEPISTEDSHEPEIECYFCGCRTDTPFKSVNRWFCSTACWRAYAE
jgi:hypothetical protein